MIVIDVNLLIYAHNSRSDEQAAAKEWLEHALSIAEPVGFPWAVIHSFLRLTTGRVVLPSFAIDPLGGPKRRAT